MRLVLFLLPLLLSVAACSSGESDDPMLHLASGDQPESEVRALTKALLSGPGAENWCRSAVETPPEVIVEQVVNPEVEGAPTPVQEPDPDDLLRVATIVLEECDRVLEGSATSTPAAPPTAEATPPPTPTPTPPES